MSCYDFDPFAQLLDLFQLKSESKSRPRSPPNYALIKKQFDELTQKYLEEAHKAALMPRKFCEVEEERKGKEGKEKKEKVNLTNFFFSTFLFTLFLPRK